MSSSMTDQLGGGSAGGGSRMLATVGTAQRPLPNAHAHAADRSAGEITRLLREWAGGQERASHRLMPLVYQKLRFMARGYLRKERADHTLQPTALVHEAYLRLAGQARVHWQSRAHFFGIASQAMRRVLVDHARKRKAAKRSGVDNSVPLDASRDHKPRRPADLVALDDCLRSLGAIDPRQERLVELKYFAGLSTAETAECLGVSATTVKREWAFARAWLRREIRRR